MLQGQFQRQNSHYKWKILFKPQTLLLLGICIMVIFSSLNFQQVTEAIVLKQGSQGQEVREVQQKLKNWGYYTGSVDGIYGSKTKEAVIYFQKSNGLTADGIVGKSTFEALGLQKYAATTASTAATTTGNSDITLLGRAIQGEAEGEPYIGKVAVGAVLINRVGSPDFPNSLSGVVYQGLALESVANGRIYTAVNADCLKAARDAYNGYDPTYGCLYFWNPSKKVNPWVWSREIIVTYGNHVFAK